MVVLVLALILTESFSATLSSAAYIAPINSNELDLLLEFQEMFFYSGCMCCFFRGCVDYSKYQEYNVSHFVTGPWYGIAIKDTYSVKWRPSNTCVRYVLNLEADRLSIEYRCARPTFSQRSPEKLLFDRTGYLQSTTTAHDHTQHNVRIVDTDYENFIIVYGCKDGADHHLAGYMFLVHSPNITAAIRDTFNHFTLKTALNQFPTAPFPYLDWKQYNVTSCDCPRSDVACTDAHIHKMSDTLRGAQSNYYQGVQTNQSENGTALPSVSHERTDEDMLLGSIIVLAFIANSFALYNQYFIV